MDEQRELLEGQAGALFKEIVVAGALAGDDPRLRSGSGALHLLIDLGLLRELGDGSYVPEDPALVQARLVAPMSRQAAELLAESSAWADTLSGLSQDYRRSAGTGSPMAEIIGLPRINAFLETAVDDAEFELLTAQPAGPRKANVLDEAVQRDLRALHRGVAMHTLYQHTARRSRATREYVDLIQREGGQVRTLDEFFNRLIVIDRRLAVIPGSAPDVAVACHDPNLVAYLADVFDRYWERGRPYDDGSTRGESEVDAEVRSLTVRMLIEGYSDAASAKRVGVSPRTYASYVAALKEEYAVETRFQLGYAMGQESH